MDGLEAEFEGRDEGEMETAFNGARVANGDAVTKGKQVDSFVESKGSRSPAVPRASHPELMDGSKVVNAERSPNRQGFVSGKNERDLRDVTNNMSMGSLNSKPTFSGLRSGMGIVKEKGVDLAGGAHVTAAQVNAAGGSDDNMRAANGLGPNGRPHLTRRPNPNSRGDKKEVSGKPQFVRIRDRGGQIGEKGEESAEQRRYDDDMLDDEAAASTAGHTGQQLRVNLCQTPGFYVGIARAREARVSLAS